VLVTLGEFSGECAANSVLSKRIRASHLMRRMGEFVYLTRALSARLARVRKNFLRVSDSSDKSAARSRATVQRLLLCHFEFEQQSFIVERAVIETLRRQRKPVHRESASYQHPAMLSRTCGAFTNIGGRDKNARHRAN